jgi:hypothetical protein
MTSADFKRFCVAWTSTAKIYGQQQDAETLSLIFKILAGFNLPTIEAALTAHLKDQDRGRFMPKPADLIAHLSASAEEITELAWAALRDATRGSPLPNDPALLATVRRLGGIELLRDKTTRELDFMRKSFGLLYSTATREASTAITSHPFTPLEHRT